MSPRRNHPRGGDSPADRPEETGTGRGPERTETWHGEEWSVRPIAASATGKHYRCPGCDQEIPPTVGHLVAWPEYGGGVDDRRHWHRACWNAKDRRTTRVQRSRNAPRY
ncbi:ATP/GTP-binding protein [Streptomyces sp. H10-C2]|uniref:ATP/GTP-binding protein n=1 Tax=unclassified Streptomyces TaxID=2593676 RepID=UPI0024B9EF57|nr:MULTISPECIES: ATP/GTP-binding protein [unclassified Streptomyces]MDJ0341516.1 ATP/GTP-binding protein [Streptomyces sp. PH10-H1]MDJ0369173.1 ATP/GTP-binding protein [Streptomyces sp. H10-C2]